MQRDIRDPQFIGNEIIRAHARHPGDSVAKIADEVLRQPLPNFEERRSVVENGGTVNGAAHLTLK